jgi:transposase
MLSKSEVFPIRRNTDDQAIIERCIMGSDCAIFAGSATQTERGAAARAGSSSADGNSLCAAFRHSLADVAKGAGLRISHDLLAKVESLAGGGPMGEDLAGALAGIRQDRQHQLVAGRGGQQFGPGGFWGPQTGPNPTDRARNGSKHHVITDAQGVPLAVRLTGANVHDVTQLQPLVEAIPPIPGRRGRPRQRPTSVQGDRAYDSEPHRQWLRTCRIQPVLAQRYTAHGSGLGKTRWVIERTIAWLHHCRRLRIRWERRDDVHYAFLLIGCILICWSFLQNGF